MDTSNNNNNGELTKAEMLEILRASVRASKTYNTPQIWLNTRYPHVIKDAFKDLSTRPLPWMQSRISDEVLRMSYKESLEVVDIDKINRISMNCIECAICLQTFDDEQLLQQQNNKDLSVFQEADREKKVRERKRKLILKNCGHKFHYYCINSWFEKENYTCPICRRVPRGSILEP